MKKLDHSFYSQPAKELAKDLIGKIIVRRIGDRSLQARIVETEAYIGVHDLACHASKGRTNRTEVMFGKAGHAYVYLIYGMYDMFNIVASVVDDPQAVLVRAAEPLDGWKADLSGPGKLARRLEITRKENGLDLTGDQLFIADDLSKRPRILATRRIGIDYAGEWKDKLLRFLDSDSVAVSRRRIFDSRFKQS